MGLRAREAVPSIRQKRSRCLDRGGAPLAGRRARKTVQQSLNRVLSAQVRLSVCGSRLVLDRSELAISDRLDACGCRLPARQYGTRQFRRLAKLFRK